MANWRRKITVAAIVSKMLQFFLQGLLVIAPVGITIYAVLWLFNIVDNILPNILSTLFPYLYDPNKKLPGAGFVTFVLLVIFIGWVSQSFFVSRLVSILDMVLEHTPGVRFIYTSIKDFIEAFAGNKKKFDKPVLVNVDGADVWRVGFITQKDALHFQMLQHAVVYVPHSYAISGITYIVPKEKIKLLNNISAADAMKFTVSGGITEVDV